MNSQAHLTTRRRSRMATALVAASALLLAACGDDDDDSAGTAAPSATTAAAPSATEASSSATTAAPESAPAETASDGEPCIKVASLILANESDNGWSYSHVKASEEIKNQIPCAEVTILKDVPESPEVEGTIRQLVEDGNQLILSTSFGYQDYLNKVAAEHPEVKFDQLTGIKTSDNVTSYFGASEEGAYLSGIAAAKVTKAKVIGYVAPFGIPNILNGINALALGAQSIDPTIEVRVVFVNSWFDPALERQAADSLFDDGADIVAMNMDSPAVGESAKTKGGHWIGYTSPQISVSYPDGFLTAPVYNWDKFYVSETQAVIDGTWKSQFYYGNLADGFISLAPLGPAVDADTKALIEQKQQDIVNGTLNIWQGPIEDQSGKVVVADGEVLPPDQIFATNFLVKGVTGQIPG